MKKIFLALFIFFGFLIRAQTSVSYISYEYTEILYFSISIEYHSYDNSYIPYSPYGYHQQNLATLQARYDRNWEIISKEWGKLLSLKLINQYNQATLALQQNEISEQIRLNCKGDLSDQAYADQWIYYVTQTFRVESIRNEIILLKKCQNEIARLEYEDPDGYTSSSNYIGISNLLKRLETCSLSEIPKLSWVNSYTTANTTAPAPAAEKLLLVVVDLANTESFINCFFEAENGVWRFFVCTYSNTSKELISFSGGTYKNLLGYKMTAVEDNSPFYQYSFDWSYENSYDTKTGLCRMMIDLYPTSQKFILRFEDTSTNRTWNYSGTYFVLD